ncbi:hypothetical protein BJV74DRAFT_858028 [Russula compacta]|nr:hypothetical protein BJV74DRAFT_858028 [Russula compacta]
MPWCSEEDLWNLAFSNVGRESGQRGNNHDVARAIQAISGFAPPSSSDRRSQDMTAGGKNAATQQQARHHNDRRSTPQAYTYTVPNVPNSGSGHHRDRYAGGNATNATMLMPPPQFGYPTSHGIPGRRPRALRGTVQPWRVQNQP